ncbi:hypothetical protein KEM52_006541, partial [Ascosphaera acerosa]
MFVRQTNLPASQGDGGVGDGAAAGTDADPPAAAVRHRPGSHFEEHAAAARSAAARSSRRSLADNVDSSNIPRLSGAALQVAAKDQPCPNHPRPPVLLDRSLFAKKQEEQQDGEWRPEPVVPHDLVRHAADDELREAAESSPAPDGSRLEDPTEGGISGEPPQHATMPREPRRKASRFSLRSLPSRLFSKKGREKVDLARLYDRGDGPAAATAATAAAVDRDAAVARAAHDMSSQIQAMQADSRAASEAVRSHAKKDRSGSHFDAFHRREPSGTVPPQHQPASSGHAPEPSQSHDGGGGDGDGDGNGPEQRDATASQDRGSPASASGLRRTITRSTRSALSLRSKDKSRSSAGASEHSNAPQP